MATYTKKNQPKTSRSPKRLLVTAIAALVVFGGGLAGYHYWHKDSSQQSATGTQTGTGKIKQQDINYQPSTPEESQDSNDAKDKIVEDKQHQPTPGTPSTSQTVTPVISSAGVVDTNVEIGSYVQGVVEDSGTCTLTATQGSKMLTRSEQGIANASNTVCPTFSIEKSAFPTTGSWKFTISYTSGRASGTSQPSTVEVK